MMMELEVEPNPATSAQVSVEQTPRRHVQCLAADALDSDSSDLFFEAVSASSVSDKMKRAGISHTPSPSSNSGSAIPRCKQTPTSNAGSPPLQRMRSLSTTPEWGRMPTPTSNSGSPTPYRDARRMPGFHPQWSKDPTEHGDSEDSKAESDQCSNAAEDIHS